MLQLHVWGLYVFLKNTQWIKVMANHTYINLNIVFTFKDMADIQM